MTTSAWLKTVALWSLILVLAILNGAVREKALVPALGSFAGLLASGVILCVGIFIVALLAAPWYGPLASRQWLLVGLVWLLLTLVIEFGFGRLAQDKTWTELLEAYAFRGGNIWPLVLLAAFISPWLAARIRGLV